MHVTRRPFVALATLGLAALLTAPMLTTEAFAAPGTIAVHGVMNATGGGAAPDGSYVMYFRLYNGKDAKKAVWQEGPVALVIKGGRFSHALGTTKALAATVLSGIAKPWLGIAINQEPEMQRVPVHAVPYARVAAQAAGLDCTNCIGTKQIAAGSVGASDVGFAYAGAADGIKGGPAKAAKALSCTGCVSNAHLKFSGDLNLGKHGLKAGKVTANSVVASNVTAGKFVGDGSALTGIKTPAGKCPVGKVVSGIDASGKLICSVAMDPKALPKDGLDEISNGLLHNQFVDEAKSAKAVGIPDNNPGGVSSVINFPDVGIAQKLWVTANITNSNITQVEVSLKAPNGASYLLWKKGTGKKGGKIVTSWPAPTKTVSGNLAAWHGKNPKGKWTLTVKDSGFLNNKTDGAINSWSVKIQTLSSKKVAASGLFQANGGLQLLRADKPPRACDQAAFGFMYASPKNNAIMICNGKEWFPLLMAAYGTLNSPAVSCKDLLTKAPLTKSGVYWLDSDGPGGEAPWQTWCDMDHDGGGWTLAIRGTLKGSYNASKNQPLSSTKGFMYAFNRVKFRDVLVKPGNHQTSSHWVSFHKVGDGNTTLDQRIQKGTPGKSYSVDYNVSAPFKRTNASKSLANVPEMQALSLRMSQTSGPNDAMFFVVTRTSRGACNSYNPVGNYRYVTGSGKCLGVQLGFRSGNYSWSSWKTRTDWSTGCGVAGYWNGSETGCQSSGAVFVR